MLKRIIKVLLISIVCILLVSCIYNVVNAASYDDEMKNLINKNDWTDTTGTDEKVQNVTNTMIITVRIVGTAIAIIMLIVIGAKYMIAAPGEKADIKKAAIPYIIGAILLFGAVQVLGLINTFSSVIK